jgi:hypothetical protein
VTSSSFTFHGAPRLSLDERCSTRSPWNRTAIARAAGRLGCVSSRTSCTAGPDVKLCQDVCTKLVALAQARCVDMATQIRVFSFSYSKSKFKCCNTCTRWDRLFGLCP